MTSRGDSARCPHTGVTAAHRLGAAGTFLQRRGAGWGRRQAGSGVPTSSSHLWAAGCQPPPPPSTCHVLTNLLGSHPNCDLQVEELRVFALPNLRGGNRQAASCSPPEFFVQGKPECFWKS